MDGWYTCYICFIFIYDDPQGAVNFVRRRGGGGAEGSLCSWDNKNNPTHTHKLRYSHSLRLARCPSDDDGQDRNRVN